MNTNYPELQEFWSKRRVYVMGGIGFPGSFVVEKLRRMGQQKYSGLYRRIRPGEFGANRECPAEFFYDKLMTPATISGMVWVSI